MYVVIEMMDPLEKAPSDKKILDPKSSKVSSHFTHPIIVGSKTLFGFLVFF